MRLFSWKKNVKNITFSNKNNCNFSDLMNYNSKDNENILFKKEQHEKESIFQNIKDEGFLFLKEYIVNDKYKSIENINILNNIDNNLLNNSIKKIYLSSNNSDEIKFYQNEYINDGNGNKNINNIKFSMTNNSKKNDISAKIKNLGNSKTISPRRIFSSLNPKFSKHSVNFQDSNNISTDSCSPKVVNYNKELDNLFSKIRPLMREKYFEYKELLKEFNLWEDNGFKNGIQFFRKKDNNEIYSTIRGIIEIDLNKENDLFYESLFKKKISIEKSYHLGDLITSRDLVNYIWSSDPLTYDNTVDRSYRVHTWDDNTPGYCIYYHSYKGSLGVQGREFLLVGYKDDSDNFCDRFSKRNSCSINSIYSPISPILTQSLIKDVPINRNIDNSKTSPKSESSNHSIDQINNQNFLKIRRKSKRNKKNERISNLMNNQEKIIDSSFFISSDLSEELSNDNLFNSIKQNNKSPSFINAKCYLNGIKVDKILKNDNKFLRMDILWIGDLNGKLPEFLKRTLLSMSLSTMKVLKDNFMESKKKELLNVFKDSHLNHKT